MACGSDTDWAQAFAKARQLAESGQKQEALALSLENQRHVHELCPPADPLQIQALIECADMHLKFNQFAAARGHLSTAITRAEKEQLPGPLATACYNLGWMESNLARYAEAESHFSRALELRTQVNGPASAPVAEVINSQAVLAENRGDYARAEPLFLQALELQRKVLGTSHAKTATTLNNLGTLYWLIGDNARAEEYLLEALLIRCKILGPEHLSTGTVYNNLGLLQRSLGDYDQAAYYFRRALRNRHKHLGAEHLLTQTTLNNLALVYLNQHQYTRALPLFEQALDIRRRVLSEPHPDMARALFNCALAHEKLRHYPEAESLYNEALMMRQKILGAHPETAGSHLFLGRLQHRLGRLDEAFPHYQEALAIQDKLLSPNHPDRLKTLDSLACYYLDIGKPAMAAPEIERTLGIHESLIQSAFAFGSEGQRLKYRESLHPVDLPASLGDAALIARSLLHTKAVVLNSLMVEQRLRRSDSPPEFHKLLDSLQTVSRQMDRLSETSDETGLREELAADHSRLAKKFNASLRLPASLKSSFTGEAASVTASLLPHEVLVEYLIYEKYAGRLETETYAGCLLYRPGQAPLWVELGPYAPLRHSILRYQKALHAGTTSQSLKPVLQELHRRLWLPIHQILPAGTTRAVICPDSEINLVSFATLLDEQGNFIVQKLTLEYASSARDRVGTSPGKPASALTLTVMASPNFYRKTPAATKSAPAQTPSPEGLIFPELTPLPYTLEEAQFLKSHAQGWGWKVEVYTGTDASEKRLTSMPAPSILHFATHGLFLTGTRDLDEESIPAPGFSPMNRSLLALAGAQTSLDLWKRGKYTPSEIDGLLTAREVSGLNLSATWLVVLSACDTGTGTIQGGEGVLGLRRGFALAGAQHLCMTLWPAADRETLQLMQKFYPALVKGDDPAEALCQVQRDLLVRWTRERGLSTAVRTAGPFVVSR